MFMMGGRLSRRAISFICAGLGVGSLWLGYVRGFSQGPSRDDMPGPRWAAGRLENTLWAASYEVNDGEIVKEAAIGDGAPAAGDKQPQDNGKGDAGPSPSKAPGKVEALDLHKAYDRAKR